MPALRYPLPRSTAAGRQARGYIDALEDVPEELRLKLRMAVSELVNNAVVHGAGQITLVLDVEADRVRCEVIDEGRRPAGTIGPRQPDDQGGRGLHIVAAVSDEWGAYDGTTHVWCEFRNSSRH